MIEAISAGLVTAAILAVLARIWSRSPLSSVRLAFRVVPRMGRAGVSNIFASREEYVHNRKPSSATEYMATAEHQLMYVGFWLAHASEIEALHRTLRSILDRGVRVTLVLLEADLAAAQRDRLAAVLDLSAAGLRDRLQNAWGDLLAFRAGLPADVASRLTLRAHREHLQASAFVIDRGHPTAKNLIDIKLYGMGRNESFGMELRPPKRNAEGSLYARATRSFELIDERATAVER